jgi:ribosomal-protein-alanine acetyltransferase
VNIRSLLAEDLLAVESIQAASSEASQWRASDYRNLLDNSGRGWVASSDPLSPNHSLGFIFIRHASDEMEVLNLAVHPAHRRRGIGRQLLHESTLWAAASGILSVWLEVRASNSSAVRFYQAHRFRVVGSRPRYYSHPTEDALLLTAAIP